MKLELKRFNPQDIKQDSVIVFIGKRNTGKSVCMKDILSYNKDIPVGIVISPTESANGYFEKFIPKMLVYDEYTPDITKKFLDRQIKINNEKKIEMKKNGTTDIDSRAFLILDDCLYDKSWPNDKSIRSFFMNGRHYKIFFLITMQYCMGVPPVLRSNIDYVFIFRNNVMKEREKLYQHYAGMFPTFDIFNTVMDKCTENYECIVIDNKVQSNKLEDQVKWFKARDNLNFRMCNSELWDICAMEQEKEEMNLMYDKDYENDEPFDIGAFAKNRNRPKINVKKKH